MVRFTMVVEAMKMIQTLFVEAGQSGVCTMCGDSKQGPAELYLYEDDKGQKVRVCFQCRHLCTSGRQVDSLTQRKLL